ncbi:hypothetical protein N7509_009527 [Penicillium cosmopolitanum]|uniref:Xylanolytic transcriptional activator regulatory domain-containing protein n=1 Tax=Penicillium cosmopolitanum TaxID=1131564 RepID=A0A9W9VPK4_9EURO|nr:uncharacterized protein N7509_009527 [Penicillium cosmopolitanum]KAJ5386986.1 hypothetical protein N7509_009527 [Penicillium cosmopolitanum]
MRGMSAKKHRLRVPARYSESGQRLGELTEQSATARPSDGSLHTAELQGLGVSQPVPVTPVPTQASLNQSDTVQERDNYHASQHKGTQISVEGESHQARTNGLPFSYLRGQQRLEAAHSPQIDLPEDGPQVYGATSLLHDQSSDTPLANRKNRDAETPFLPVEIVRDQLISNAAIRRQEELSLKLTPSLGSRIDFDGVPMDLAMHLFELHWNRQHLSYLLTYRPAIMDSLVNNGPYMNKLLLNAIYLQSSLYSDRTSSFFNHQTSNAKGLLFYERFKSLLPNYLDNPTIPTVVALLTCGACLVPYGHQSAGWALSGMGYQMVIDLGCHLESSASSRCTAIEQEMKKRIYWAAFVGDKLQSLFLGRPYTMHESNGTVSEAYLDCFEEMEEWKPYADTVSQPVDSPVQSYQGRPSHAISTFHSLLQLCKIAAHIIESFYSVRSSAISELTISETHHEITEKLRVWRDNLPSCIRFDPSVDVTPPPHQITPHALYWTLVILSEQTFLNRGHFNFTVQPELVEASREKCIQAALSIWKLVEAYKEAFTLRRAQYGISYATYCAALVMLQHTNQDNAEHVECIRFFWSALLQYQKGCCYGLQRPLKLLKSLMRRLESVPNNTEAERPVTNWPTPTVTAHDSLGLEIEHQLEFDQWDASLLGSIPDDMIWDDNSIFGMFGG